MINGVSVFCFLMVLVLLVFLYFCFLVVFCVWVNGSYGLSLSNPRLTTNKSTA